MPACATSRVVTPIVRAFIVLALCALALAPHAAAFVSARSDLQGAERVATATTAGFKIRGRVTGLLPGKRKSLRLRVANPNAFAIRVKWLSVQASAASDECLAFALELPQKKTMSLNIPAGEHAAVRYPVRLSAGAPSACQLARWPLRYRGEARRA